jgi:hypothetical protein
MTTIDEMEMPAPDTIVNCKNGGPIAAMFFYAASEQDLGEIASEHGFETRTVTMEDTDPDDELSERWFNGDEKVLNEWNPPEMDGWTLAAKLDNEDGPIAIYIKPGAVLAERRAAA